MGFGWAGAGGAASQALEEIMAQQMVRAQMAQRQKEQAAQLALQTRQVEGVEQDRKSNRENQAATVALNQRRFDSEQADQATDRNISLDAANVLNMPGMTDEAKANEFRQSALRNPNASSAQGMLRMIEGLTKKPTRHAVTTTGANGRPTRRLVSEEELEAGVEEYREQKEPRQEPAPDFEWVMRGGQPLQIRKGTAQQGDKPYDVVAERKQPGDTGPSAYSVERSARTMQSVDELMGKVSGKTTGWGNLAAGIPASDAMNFSSELDTLKANIAFNELTAMREASKTGGALGQVSNIELRLLESALGALNPRQSPENLKEQLGKIKESIGRWQQASGIGDMMPATSGSEPSGGGSLYEQYLARKKGGG